MATIKEYTSPIDTIQPEETGAMALARAGNVIRENSREAGQLINSGFQAAGAGLKQFGSVVEERATQREMSQGAAVYAGTFGDLTQKWNTYAKQAMANGQGDDPDLAKNFMAQVAQPALEQFQGAFHTDAGKKWATERVAALSTHLTEKGLADMSHMAGTALEDHIQTFLDQSSNAVAADPSTHKFWKSQIEPTVNELIAHSANLSADDAETVRTKLLHHAEQTVDEAAFYGLLAKPGGASAAEALVKSGQLTEIDGVKAAKEISAARHVERSEGMQARSLQHQEELLQSERAGSAYMTKLQINPDGTMTVPDGWMRQVLTDNKLMESNKRALLGVAEGASRLQMAPEGSSSFMGTLKDQMVSQPDRNFTQEIAEASSQQKISNQQMDELLKFNHTMLDDPTTAKQLADPLVKGAFEQLKIATGMTTQYGVVPSEANAQAYNKGSSWLQAQIMDGIRQGKTIQQLMNPSSNDYVLKGVDIGKTFGGGTVAGALIPPPPSPGESTQSEVARARAIWATTPGNDKNVGLGKGAQ